MGGSDKHIDTVADSHVLGQYHADSVDTSYEIRLGPGHYHSERGLTDGCYALYNNVELVDQVLAQTGTER